MPRGKPLTKAQRAEIMVLHESEEYSQIDIAELLDLGGSTVSRVINQELGLIDKPATKRTKLAHKRNISVAATFEDHKMISEYANQHNLPMHEALHALLHRDNDLIETIQREVSVMLEAAKTEVEVIKKKWWQL